MNTQNLRLKMVCYWQWVKIKYSHHNPITFLTKSIESSLYDYSDAYILVMGNIAVADTADIALVATTQVHLKIVHRLKNVWQKLMVLSCWWSKFY